MTNLRRPPSVDALSRSVRLSAYPERVRVAAARAAVAQARGALEDGGMVDWEALAEAEARKEHASSLRPVVNLSGVILHTGIGRARLAPAAVEAARAAAASHASLEIDLDSGVRGDRQTHVRGLLQKLTGAEDALVVNNAAAGVLLTLSALVAGREVILSRGQMVEIGGSFRMPDIVRQSGCILVEVGCTNKTRLTDYEEAVTEETAAILRCHPSNFKIIGFTEEPALAELSAFCRERGLLLLDDQGSGCLIDLTRFGLPAAPTLPGSVAGGADVSIASGDKLLGGPQAGLIVGRAELIALIKRHPLARAVRIDKLTLSALEATLRLYVQGREEEIPTIRYLSRPLTEVRALALSLKRACGPRAVLGEGVTEIGGGSAPGPGLPTVRVGIPDTDLEDLAKRLRNADTPIIGRIESGCLWLDPRTLDREELQAVTRTMKEVLSHA